MFRRIAAGLLLGLVVALTPAAGTTAALASDNSTCTYHDL